MSESKSERRFRKLTALSMAVTTVLPASAVSALAGEGRVGGSVGSGVAGLPLPLAMAVTASSSSASASSEAAATELLVADNEALRLAVDQYDARDYEEAAATLSSVKADELSAGDKGVYSKLQDRVSKAVEARKAARASYEQGETLLAQGKLAEAISAYRTASDSRFVDRATRTKALEQIALAQTQQRSAEIADQQVYGEAKAAMKAGDMATAKQKFQGLVDHGFKPALFQTSPADYLREIAKREASATPAVAATPAPAPAAVESAAATPAVTPAAVTPPAVATATVAAPAEPASVPPVKVEATAPVMTDAAPATPAAAPAAEPVMAPATGGPAVTVTPLNGGTPAPETMTAAPAAAPAPAPEAAPAPAAEPVVDRKAEARKYYLTGRKLYREGDWIEARKNFVAAAELGYKPGLFEDSAQKYLQRMDKKEQADAAKAAEALAAQSAPVAAPAPAPAAPAAPAVTVAPEATPAQPAVAAPTPETTPAPAPVAVAPEAAPAAPSTPATDNVARAQELVAQARAAQASGDNVKALGLYTEASALDPNNQQAVAGRNELAAAAQPGGTLLTEQERRILGRRQVTQYQFDQAIGTARERTAQGDFAAARQAIEEARLARNTDPTIFTPAEIQRFDNEIAATQTGLDQAVAARKLADEEQASKQRVANEQARADQARAERERTVAALISQARKLVEDTRYQEALNVVDQILAIDPQNDYAQGVRPLIEDRALLQQQRRYRDDYGTQLAKQFSRADEARVPYDDLLRFPENWPDISELRDQANAERKGAGSVDAATLALLNRRLPEVRFENVAFGDVIEALRDMTGASIQVEWRTLETAGIDRTTPVTVARLTNQRFEKVLQAVLREVGGGTVQLDFSVEEGLITISTKEQIGQKVYNVVYDVSDLLFRPLDAGRAPELQFQLDAVTRGGGGGSGGNLFGGSSSGSQEQDRPPEQLLQDLVQLIETLVTPDQWSTNGGSGNIRPFQAVSSYSLIVTASRTTHRELDDLLNKLRASQAVQVSIDARFLTVSRSFLEDIGLDIDVDLNRGGVNSRKFGSNTGANGAFVPNIPIRQNSSSLTANPRTGLPSALSSSDTATSPAFSVQGAFLDDFSVSVLLRATQQSVSSSTVSAPRLTLFSGQRARVIVGSYQFFVTDLTPVVGTGAVAFTPEPSAVFTGVQLWVQAVVSSDRKYVQLNLVPQLRALTGVQNFVFQTAATDTGTGGVGGGVGTGFANPVAGIATATIQLPTQSSTQVYTSASVPDGGTVLLGGLTQGGEVYNEAGVPILSKIPFIKRLFTNNSSAKDESVVLILVKPSIIIAREVESRSFPLLNSKVAQ